MKFFRDTLNSSFSITSKPEVIVGSSFVDIPNGE
jgi:hypothetical protein